MFKNVTSHGVKVKRTASADLVVLVLLVVCALCLIKIFTNQNKQEESQVQIAALLLKIDMISEPAELTQPVAAEIKSTIDSILSKAKNSSVDKQAYLELFRESTHELVDSRDTEKLTVRLKELQIWLNR